MWIKNIELINYRNYKKDFINILDEVYEKSQTIRYMGDKENSEIFYDRMSNQE